MSVCLEFLRPPLGLFFRKYHRDRAITRMAIPPTTPPAIAPTGVVCVVESGKPDVVVMGGLDVVVMVWLGVAATGRLDDVELEDGTLLEVPAIELDSSAFLAKEKQSKMNGLVSSAAVTVTSIL
jgi:hypothetical protein